MQPWYMPILNARIFHIKMQNTLDMAQHNIEYANVAHPNMGDANVAPLDDRDCAFAIARADKTYSLNISFHPLGPKIDENDELGLNSGYHRLPEPENRVAGP